MTLQQLEYVVAVDKYRHFIKAAEACGITQSTLSAMIRKLEDELDITIFDRNSHPVCPTMAGEDVIRQARIVLFHSAQLQELSSRERNQASGNIKMGVTPTMAPYILPKLFSYINKVPDVTMTASELYRDNIVAKLMNAELDMAIMSLPQHDDKLLEIPLYKEKMWAFVSPLDPMYEQETINFDTMPRERLWALKHEICFQKQLEGLSEYESERSSTFESGNVWTLLHIVNENEGFTLIPELHIPLLLEIAKKNVRPFAEPAPVRNVSLFVRADYVRESLINIVVEGIKTIIPEEMLDERLLKYKVKI